MRKKLVSLGFALAALVAASTFAPAAADGPLVCPGTGYRVITCADGVHHMCCPDFAMCYC